MKKVITIIGIFGLILVQAQKVGINQDAPKATLDIKAETANTTEEVEGLLVPRVSKNKAFLMAGNTTTPLKESTLVYIDNTADYTTTPVATSVADITEKGYYFWNGSKWAKTAGKDGVEWVYDPATKQTNLKRSGTAPFGNQVLYAEKGNYMNYTTTSTPTTHINYNDNNVVVTSAVPSPYTIKVASYLRRATSDLGDHGSTPTTENKTLSSNALTVDATKTKTKSVYTAQESYNATSTDNTNNYTTIRGVVSSAIHNGTGAVRYLIGQSSYAQLRAGSSAGYVTGTRSSTQAHNKSTAKRLSGYSSYTSLTDPTSIQDISDYFSSITYGSTSATSVTNSYNLNLLQVLNGGSPTITNAAGLYYRGFIGTKGGATITNNYGILLEDINEGTNNYAIFTKAGKVRLGDDVSIGTTTAPKKLSISGVMRLEPQDTAPTGVLGDLYVGTNNKLYFHNGTTWKEVQLAP